jgi:probable F420-dependent oxidoreductase
VAAVTRPFRFGLQVAAAGAREQWAERARAAEALGFDTLVVPDHLVDGAVSPLVALCTIAEVTSLRVGTLVLNNDFRHPAVLAREAATVDLLTDGRLELGIGAGHAAPEYAEIGLPFDPPAVRVERLGEALEILTRLFDGETVNFAGAHYRIDGHTLYPARRPTLLVGGNGNRLLHLAARHADVVGLSGLERTLPDGQRHTVAWRPEQVDAKVQLVRETAGARFPDLELQALVQHVEITDDRVGVATKVAARVGVPPEVVIESPYVLIGTVGEIVDALHHARERFGFSYFVTRAAAETGRVIAALARGEV